MPTKSQHPETLVLHAGYRSDPTTNAVAVPIYQTTSYQFRDTQHAANLFGLAELGNIYTRIMNPTNAVLEERVAALEGGVAALALASGQAASLFAVQNICQAGDNFVSSTDLYGGTWNLFLNTMMKTMGMEVRFVDPADPENFRRATDARTRCYYAETLPNPKLEVFPIGEVAKIGRELGVPLIVDNTAAPVLCRPIDHGAAVVMHSTTKYIGGHGTSIGGIVVDGGNFDWEKHADRFPLLNQPDPSYHGAVWTQAVKPLGPIAYILKMRVTLLRDLGAPMSPFNAFLFIQGLETLPLRMRAHCANAMAVAKFLAEHPKVTRVIHPSLMTGEARRRADAYLKGGYGGLRRLRAQRRHRGRAALHRRAQDVLPCRQYRRRAQPGDPSGFDDPFAAVARRAAADRGHRQLCPAVDRDRARGRHPRRPGAGARRRLTCAQRDPAQRMSAGEAMLPLPWPIDLALTVASHGWAHLAPWRWDPETGRLARRERIGGRLGTIAIRQPDLGGVSSAGRASRGGHRRDPGARAPLGVGRLGAGGGDRHAPRRFARRGGADPARRRPDAPMLVLLRGFRQDRADHQHQLVVDLPDGGSTRRRAG